jgi:hypothetical protein
MAIAPDGKCRNALVCAQCGTFVRLLRRHGDPEPALDPADAEDRTGAVPPAGSWFLALVLGGDGVARPVALGDSLGKTWEAALWSNLWGAVFIMATDPPRISLSDGRPR